ncbi:hypothetical protein HD806DRAFT_1662 [Xylariaceae sp. AK1471]|nr:hypothetical protein HD806DRAFT_1662 [Xylariaceae sp. AK1471]
MTTPASMIVVQPPRRNPTGQIIYPPVVVRCLPNQEHTFYQVVIMGTDGNPVSQRHIGGTMSMNPQPLQNAPSSSGGSSQNQAVDYVAFPDLAINRSGTYVVQINVIQMDYTSSPPSAYCTEQLTSREIRVRSSTVAYDRPSREESQLLTILLNDGNFRIPQPPQ